MEEIGRNLKQARSRLGLTLDEAERSTRIRARYLDALERGDLAALPSQVQARGFLRNYAEYLGLDHQALLQRYSEEVHSQRTRPLRKAKFEEATTRPSVSVRPRRVSSDLILAAVITVSLLAVLIWGLGRLAASLRERAQQASPFLIPTFTPELASAATDALLEQPAAVQSTATLALEFEPVLTSGVDLRLLVERRSFVIVAVDGAEVYRGRPAPGELLEYQADDLVRVTTGNAGGLRVFYRGEDQGLMGEQNQAVVRFWTVEGAVTPTPSPTSLPSATPEPSLTPTPGFTPQPTATG